MAVEIQMPAMGESVTEGTVLEWHVSEGDSVSEGDTVVEVSTDKVDAEVPAPADGTISKLLVSRRRRRRGRRRPRRARAGRGRRSGNGSAPAAKEEPAEAEAGREAPAASRSDGASAETATSDDASVSAGGTTDDGALQVVMPEMGESVTEGTVLEWRVAEGDAINEGDTIVEVSTDKVDAEVPAPTSGTVTKLHAEVDETIDVGAVLAEIKPGEGAAAPAKAATDGGAADRGEGGRRQRRSDFEGKITPVARRVAAEQGVDLSSVSGSGPGGKVTKEDVLAAANGDASGTAAPAAAPRRRRRARPSRCAAPPRCSPTR